MIMADWIEEGQKAPDFTLQTHTGEKLKLSSLRGSHVILYFYPKDDTPGCTKEACGFRDLQPDLDARGAVTLGVSPDSVESHARFRDKYDLSFSLLADPEHRVAEKYGAWREKTLYGKKSMGIVRSTFVIDPEGRVAKVFKNVRADGHAEKVAAIVDTLLTDGGR
jgi:peroxiredoxin Q/BCP